LGNALVHQSQTARAQQSRYSVASDLELFRSREIYFTMPGNGCPSSVNSPQASNMARTTRFAHGWDAGHR
jgi:hypothetical protein